MIDLVSPDFWPIVPLVPHWGISHFIWRFMDPHGLARSSSLTGCSLRRGHDRYLTKPPEIHLVRPSLLDTWMPSCFSIREVHLGSMCMIQLWIRMTSVTCSTTDDFMSLDFWPVVHLMPYWGVFSFRMRFTDLHGGYICDDRWLHVILLFGPVMHLIVILGHIFHFRWDLWIFTYVTCSMIDGFMSPDFWPVIRSMPY